MRKQLMKVLPGILCAAFLLSACADPAGQQAPSQSPYGETAGSGTRSAQTAGPAEEPAAQEEAPEEEEVTAETPEETAASEVTAEEKDAEKEAEKEAEEKAREEAEKEAKEKAEALRKELLTAAGEEDPEHPNDVTITVGEEGEDYPALSRIYSRTQEELKDINPNYVGVLYIPALKQVYPVTWVAYDNDYFLEHNFEGSESQLGGIIIDGWNQPDLTDSVTTMHGHNMKDGSMFGSLQRFLSSPSLAENEPYIYFYMEKTVKKYRIYSYFTTDIYDRVYDVPEFYEWSEEMTEDGAKVFRDYLNNWYDAYVYDLPVRAVHEVPEMNFEKRPRILLLSTCYGAPHGTDRLPLICVLESEYYLEK